MITDNENLTYYKLKYAAQIGGDIEKSVFDYHEKENYKRDGLMYGFYKPKGESKFSDYPQI